MSQAPTYTRLTGFADDERDNAGGRSTVVTADVDNELDRIAQSLNPTIANLALLQRDDGVMRDGVVPVSALGADTLKLMTGTGNVRGAWVTATAYALRDLVTQSGNTYICAVAHTSGTFATDLGAVKWVLFQIGSNPAAGSIPFSPTVNITSSNLQAALAEVDTNSRTRDAAFADTTDPTKNAGAIGFNYALSYAAGTIGKWLKDLAASAGSSFIGFIQAGAGAQARTLQDKGRDVVSLADYFTAAEAADFATGSPSLDYTAALNRATLATLAFTGNSDAPKREIRLPAGNLNIAGPVYVRKGQRLVGAGPGATRITQSPAATTSIFIMGQGLISGVATPDPGGLAPDISSLHINSSSATAPAIDTGNSSGFMLNELFLTNVGVGVSVTGGDGIIDRCFIDQGLVGMSFGACQNIIVSNCLFYLSNYQARISSGACDVQFNNCHFEYPLINSILFDTGAAVIRNFSASDCEFVLNAQSSTFTGFVGINTGDADATFDHCKFRNMKGFAVQHASGIGGDFTFSNCVFDGTKTVAAYTQSTTAGGVQTSNETMRLTGCLFKNLNTYAVDVEGSFASTVDVSGCSYKSITGATAVNIGNSSAASLVRLTQNRGDGVTPLVNAQGLVPLRLKGNVDWLGALATASSRQYVKIPFGTDGLMCTVTARADSNVAGSSLYRKSAKYVVSKSTDNNGTTTTDYAAKTLVAQDAASFAPAIDFQLDMNSVGGGANAPFASTGGYLVISMPSAYGNASFAVDFD